LMEGGVGFCALDERGPELDRLEVWFGGWNRRVEIGELWLA